MELYLLNYADDRFDRKGGVYRENQLHLNSTARQQGISNIVSWTWEDLIETDFYKNHKTYLDKSRHENGVAWKPYIILDLLKKVEYGDIVFYCDCIPWGIKRSVQPLINLCVSNNGIVFQQFGDKNSKWTKRDAFVYMNCDEPKYHEGVHLQSTWILFQKNNFNINFVEEWLKYCLDERIASQLKPNTCGLPNLPGFIDHRDDQSIFTNLAIKYNIKTFNITSNKNINEFIDLIPLCSLPEPVRWISKKIYNKLLRRFTVYEDRIAW